MRGFLALCLTTTAGLLATPLPTFAGPTTCPTGALCFDESTEGVPHLIFDSPLFLGAAGAGSGEDFPFIVEVQGLFAPSGPNPVGSFGTTQFVVLTEPGTGTFSDALSFGNIASSGSPESGTTFITFLLASDDENGNPPLDCTFCSASPQVVEDGTFQLAISDFSTGAGSFDIYFRSDLEGQVPEPASLVLFGTAVLGFVVIRGRRGLRRPQL